MCRFERAWAGEAAVTSEYPPWCALFSASDLGLFEFGEDLKYVYNDGPVYDITTRMTQPLFEVNECAIYNSETKSFHAAEPGPLPLHSVRCPDHFYQKSFSQEIKDRPSKKH